MIAGVPGWSTCTASTRGQDESLGASLPTVRMVTRESPETLTACSGPVVTVAISTFAAGSAQARPNNATVIPRSASDERGILAIPMESDATLPIDQGFLAFGSE